MYNVVVMRDGIPEVILEIVLERSEVDVEFLLHENSELEIMIFDRSIRL